MAALLSNAKPLAKGPSRKQSGQFGRGRGRTASGAPLPRRNCQIWHMKYSLARCEAHRGGGERGSVSWNSVTNEENGVLKGTSETNKDADAGPSRSGKKSLIRKWLPGWGARSQRRRGLLGKKGEDQIPLASRLDAGSADEDLFMGDGMASTHYGVESAGDASVLGYAAAQMYMDDIPSNDTFVAAAEEAQRMGYLSRDGSQPSARQYRRMSKRRGNVAIIDSPPIRKDHASLDLIRSRIESGSLPGNRADPFKLGLVVEGGGMRGCVSGGALMALSELGLQNVFDAVYGSSAGAINSTYFLSGQRDGVDIYHQHIASPDFIDLKRLINRKPGTPAALNLEFLLDHVIQEVLPLDFDAVLESPIPLKVVASSLDSLSPVLLEEFRNKEDLIECLRASANVPQVAGGPVEHRGHRLVDAAVFEAVPFRSAIADGCTHVVVLCTRPAPVRKSAIDKALADALEAAIKKAVMNPDYMVDAWRASVKHLVMDGISNDDILLRSLDEESHKLPWFAGTHVLPIYPSSHASSFSPLCTDVPTLLSGVNEGRRAVLAVARQAFGDLLDAPSLEAAHSESANIMPSKTLSAKSRKKSQVA
ncbi:hypothetical protein M9434_002800 [Picochlorum sp. BPE23]|nr:hypothetical protein M9434_002800 [Picochlorum sp. BPE23]